MITPICNEQFIKHCIMPLKFRKEFLRSNLCTDQGLKDYNSEVTKSQRNKRRQGRLQNFQTNSIFKAWKINIE